MTLPVKRPIFFVSDRTGITAEMLGNSLLSQFEGVQFINRILPFTDTPERVDLALQEIAKAKEVHGVRPIVFSSLANPLLGDQLQTADALCIDFFQMFIGPLGYELGISPNHIVGRSHGGGTTQHAYISRIEAINFTLEHDDGCTTRNLEKAQVILVGVSRCGKTPTALYLAMQFGIRAANFPLTPDDFERKKLPDSLKKHQHKLFGLSIDPYRLHRIRNERKPDSHYASVENCNYELREARLMMQHHAIPWIDSTDKSIEEIATTVIDTVKLERHMF
jgi:[pyruvate, water dikinase]-phosphate phosphotransferase / [pyruvate, water dikinase] kinase